MTEPLLRGDRRPLVFGHRGTPRLAPENTLRSLALALDRGADGFEVDVVALADGTLVAGHSLELAELCHGAARGAASGRRLAELRLLDPELATLDEVLELARLRLDGRPFLIDIKSPGIEGALIEAVLEHGLEARVIFCALERSALVRLRSLAPEMSRSLSYPGDRYRLSERRLFAAAIPVGLRVLRSLLPRRIGAWIDETGAAAATIHHELVSCALVDACHARGVALIAWVVDDVEVTKRLMAARIDAIITNDPLPILPLAQ
ncbi:MAG: glycerophosphodiester phosphodiesterase [Gaiellaceae bacterium]|jgi:glycerophosphoryl diester phosphodiesterase